jgi:hypothetical protein
MDIRFFGNTLFIPMLFLFFYPDIIDMNLDALSSFFIGFIGEDGFLHFFHALSRQSFLTMSSQTAVNAGFSFSCSR